MTTIGSLKVYYVMHLFTLSLVVINYSVPQWATGRLTNGPILTKSDVHRGKKEGNTEDDNMG